MQKRPKTFQKTQDFSKDSRLFKRLKTFQKTQDFLKKKNQDFLETRKNVFVFTTMYIEFIGNS